ncbi:hypothetical protein D3C86_1948940 [compost metagenome]
MIKSSTGAQRHLVTQMNRTNRLRCILLNGFDKRRNPFGCFPAAFSQLPHFFGYNSEAPA